MAFVFERQYMPELVLVTPKVWRDDRGLFMETYKLSDFRTAGIEADFVQDSHSGSSLGVLRGLHYQLPPFAQGKLVRVIHGAVWDVAVDIRKSSPTFGRWCAVELSAENRSMFYVPPGFAHGFVTVTESAEFVYKCTAEYHSKSERGIRWNDTDLSIEWPIEDVRVSGRDAALPLLRDAEVFP